MHTWARSSNELKSDNFISLKKIQSNVRGRFEINQEAGTSVSKVVGRGTEIVPFKKYYRLSLRFNGASLFSLCRRKHFARP